MNILFITPRFPYPPVKGDKSISFSRLNYLSKKNKVDLITIIRDKFEYKYVKKVESICNKIEIFYIGKVQLLFNIFLTLFNLNKPLQVGMFASRKISKIIINKIRERQYDLIWVSTIRGLNFVKNVKNVPIILDMIDSIAVNYENRLNFLSMIKRIIFFEEARRLKFFEKNLYKIINTAIVVSNSETKYIKRVKNIHIIPISVKLGTDLHTLKDFDIIFTGNLSYYPNYESLLYFIKNVYISIQDLKFAIVGSSPIKKLKMIVKKYNNINIYSEVDDIYNFIRRAKISIVPVRTGSGIKYKILEAFANKVPVIATSFSVSGLKDIKNMYNIIISDNKQEFLKSINLLLSNKKLADFISKNAFSTVKKYYTESMIEKKVEKIVSSVF